MIPGTEYPRGRFGKDASDCYMCCALFHLFRFSWGTLVLREEMCYIVHTLTMFQVVFTLYSLLPMFTLPTSPSVHPGIPFLVLLSLSTRARGGCDSWDCGGQHLTVEFGSWIHSGASSHHRRLNKNCACYFLRFLVLIITGYFSGDDYMGCDRTWLPSFRAGE